ncbi:uncharacterized protein [Drosophila pseudoobscura]|uniref:Uncharacterized protein n=1 Tax=Drosophila pseudoobscura pseudoobscura TaxID=46245 RepID=A0A6I8UHZ8_DROPS|nr:uncharacterized protein LOC4816186 [Drosophila pseudoobscura]
MVSKFACVTAGGLHLIGAAFFVPLPEDQYSPGPKLGSSSFLLAALLFLSHMQVIPRRFMQMAPGVFGFVEVMFTVFVTEWLMHVLWCGMERFIHWMSRIFCQNCLWCEFVVESVSTLLMGLAALYVVCEVVCSVKMKTAVERAAGRALDNLPISQGSGSFVQRLKDLRTYIKGAIYFFRLTREQRMLTIQVFEVQVAHARRGFVQESQELPSESQEEPEEMQCHTEEEASEIQESYTELQSQEEPTEEPTEFLSEEEPSDFPSYYPPLSEDEMASFDL